MKMLFTNLARSTQREERFHEYFFLQFCSEFENDGSNIPGSLRSFDDKAMEVGRKAGAQKSSKKRGRCFGSHALVSCSFEMC